jgi:hypothetical protein
MVTVPREKEMLWDGKPDLAICGKRQQMLSH